MKGTDILLGLNLIDSKYIDEAEFGEFHPEKNELPRKVLPLRKTLLVAAIVALTLVLAGCTVAYVLHLQDLHMGSREAFVDKWDENMEYQGRETVTEQVFTLSGLKGTPAYQGALAWFDFVKDYDPGYAIANALGTDRPAFPEKYDAYGVYTQEMADKLDEITEAYGLELLGPTLEGKSGKSLFRYFGVEDLLSAGSAATMDTLSAWAYETGGLYSDFFLRLPEDTGWPYDTLCSYHLNPKNALCPDSFTQAEDSTEWNYTTVNGDKVLILRDGEVNISWILCDREDAMVSVRVQSEHSVGTDQGGTQQFTNTPMTDRQLEQVADALNLRLALKPGDPTLLEGSAGDSGQNVQIQNGVAVELKKVETDGLTLYVTLGITAPEGTALPQTDGTELGILGFDTWTMTYTGDRETSGGGTQAGVQEDGDGKDNTVDYVIMSNAQFTDGKDAFLPGETWTLYLEDIHREKWNAQTAQFDTLWSSEGAWAFDITIGEGNDFRELEFVEAPFTTSGVVGMRPDGKDKFEDVTLNSLMLRAFSSRVSAVGPYEITAVDFFIGPDKLPRLVMRNGEEIPLYLHTGEGKLNRADGSAFNAAVSLDEIDYLLLVDGTKLVPIE